MGERRWGVCAACDTCVHAAPGVGGDRDDLTIHLSAAPPVLSAIRSLIIAALSRQSFSPRNAIISRLDEGGGGWGRRAVALRADGTVTCLGASMILVQ